MNPLGPVALAGLLLCSAAGAASAQSTAAPPTDLGTKGGTLSDKLNQTNGVIKPADNVDPAMRKPAPQAGTMPVIKPGQVPPQSATGKEQGTTH